MRYVDAIGFHFKSNGVRQYIFELCITDRRVDVQLQLTELAKSIGDILELHEIVNVWLINSNKNRQAGWILVEAHRNTT